MTEDEEKSPRNSSSGQRDLAYMARKLSELQSPDPTMDPDGSRRDQVTSLLERLSEAQSSFLDIGSEKLVLPDGKEYHLEISSDFGRYLIDSQITDVDPKKTDSLIEIRLKCPKEGVDIPEQHRKFPTAVEADFLDGKRRVSLSWKKPMGNC